jgi:hypothetical protein
MDCLALLRGAIHTTRSFVTFYMRRVTVVLISSDVRVSSCELVVPVFSVKELGTTNSHESTRSDSRLSADFFQARLTCLRRAILSRYNFPMRLLGVVGTLRQTQAKSF